MRLINHLHVKIWTPTILIWKMFIWNLTTYWKMKYHNLQLYKFNLYFGNCIIKVQFVGVFFVMNDVFLMGFEHSQMLESIICKLKKKILLFWPKYLFWIKSWLNITKLTRLFSWILMCDYVDPRLFVKKKPQLAKIIIMELM
jgi:hypothetical protein